MNKNNHIRKSLILGALLHDIGKFVQRAEDNPKKPTQKHTNWGVDWFQRKEGLAEKLTSILNEEEKQIVRSAIGNHHDSAKYISLADSISAGMDRIELQGEEDGDPFTKRLISILSRVSISDKAKKEMYYQLACLGGDNLKESFPVANEKCGPAEYSDLLDKFNQEINGLSFDNLTFAEIIDQIHFSLWKYTWCIPSAVYKSEPDVSLFDHLKTTGAIAGCLYDFQQENSGQLDIGTDAFRLIGGDISGIQNYIFDVLTQHGKVAKRLRARSFFVQLISEIAAHKILHSFDLPLLNLLSSAGGNFYILVPNLRETQQKIEALQKEFDEWAYDKLNGELSISLASVVVSGEELKDFVQVSEKLKKELSCAKQKPHHSFLISKDKWKVKEFIRPKVIEQEEKACTGCKHYPVEEGQEFCYRCNYDKRIGELLPKKGYLAFYSDEATRKDGFEILNYSFEMWDEKELKEKRVSKPYLVLALNNVRGAGFKYITNHIPTDSGGTSLTFDQIALKSEGDKLLGYVKADVDNMGKIFREGFKEPRLSISRFCSLSRMLETFFAGYIQMKLENDFKDIYTVFSGGDDFFVVGPWDKAINFTQRIRDDFSRFAGGNPDFTFSAGIILAKSHQPISFCAEYVENELKNSKHLPEKDRISLFDQTVKWEELKNILEQAKKVMEWLKAKPPLISHGFINSLRKYGEMSQKYSETGEAKWLKFVPLLVNDINRNLTKKEQEEPYKWAANLSPTIRKSTEEDELLYLRIIMEYVLTHTRGGAGEEKM